MATFKNISHNAVLRRAFEYWANVVRNYDGLMREWDFFDLIWRYMRREEVAEMIRIHYTKAELSPLTECGRDPLDLEVDGVNEMLARIWNEKPLRKMLRRLLELMKNRILAHLDVGEDDAAFDARFANLCSFMNLNEVEADLFMLMFVRRDTIFDDFPENEKIMERPLYYAMAIDRSYSEVLKALSKKGKLARYGCMDDEYWFNYNEFDAYFTGTDESPLDERYYKVARAEPLPWEFFGDLSEKDGALLKEMLAARAAGGRLNVLFYGAPGTGKTSFACALAKAVGGTAYELLQGERDGKNISTESRMAGIQIFNERVAGAHTLLIVDEADELLRTNAEVYGGGTGNGHTEKGVMNTILDGMRAPVIWISNAPAEVMDESVRRRFDYSICFKALTPAQRQAIWRNNVQKFGMGDIIGDQSAERFADLYETSAGGITMVLENVRRLNPEAGRVEELVDRIMKPHCELMRRPVQDGKLQPASDYSLEGLNIRGDLGLDKVVQAVRNFQVRQSAGDGKGGPDRPRMNLLLWGPPGTGKTEFVKYLGAVLKTKVVVKMGSDLLDMYVGGTEARIRDAFQEAAAEKAVLFLDEIDGLVQGRERASHSWEVTQVNELLHQMENFDGVMVGATNFFANLDQAILRRFTFKLEFGYLDTEGKRLFFERMFASRLSSAEAARLDAIPDLAPGDFRTVRQAMFYLDGVADNAIRLGELEKESSVKRQGRVSAPVGFSAA